MRFLFAEDFSKYLLLGFFKFYRENLNFLKVLYRNFLSSLSFSTIFSCINYLQIETGDFLIVKN